MGETILESPCPRCLRGLVKHAVGKIFTAAITFAQNWMFCHFLDRKIAFRGKIILGPLNCGLTSFIIWKRSDLNTSTKYKKTLKNKHCFF